MLKNNGVVIHPIWYVFINIDVTHEL